MTNIQAEHLMIVTALPLTPLLTPTLTSTVTITPTINPTTTLSSFLGL